jgi:hypothetical protein
MKPIKQPNRLEDDVIIQQFVEQNNQPSNKKHYVDNDMLRLELIKSKANGQLTNNATNMLLTMIDKIQSTFLYTNKHDKEDCRSYAIEVLLKNWHKYDIVRQNAFAFFTRTIYNGLFAGWNTITDQKQTISISMIFKESI